MVTSALPCEAADFAAGAAGFVLFLAFFAPPVCEAAPEAFLPLAIPSVRQIHCLPTTQFTLGQCRRPARPGQTLPRMSDINITLHLIATREDHEIAVVRGTTARELRELAIRRLLPRTEPEQIRFVRSGSVLSDDVEFYEVNRVGSSAWRGAP